MGIPDDLRKKQHLVCNGWLFENVVSGRSDENNKTNETVTYRSMCTANMAKAWIYVHADISFITHCLSGSTANDDLSFPTNTCFAIIFWYWVVLMKMYFQLKLFLLAMPSTEWLGRCQSWCFVSKCLNSTMDTAIPPRPRMMDIYVLRNSFFGLLFYDTRE